MPFFYWILFQTSEHFVFLISGIKLWRPFSVYGTLFSTASQSVIRGTTVKNGCTGSRDGEGDRGVTQTLSSQTTANT